MQGRASKSFGGGLTTENGAAPGIGALWLFHISDFSVCEQQNCACIYQTYKEVGGVTALTLP